MTTTPLSPSVSFKVLPMTLGLAAFAAVLVPILAAVSAALGFRSGGSPQAAVPVYVAAVACLVALPGVWAVVSRKDVAWVLAAVFAVASLLLLDFARGAHPMLTEFRGPSFSTWLLVTLSIMLSAGWLGIFMHRTWMSKRWKAFGFLTAGYALVALVGLLYASVVLFFE